MISAMLEATMQPNIIGAKICIDEVVSIIMTTRENVILNIPVSMAAADTRIGTSALKKSSSVTNS